MEKKIVGEINLPDKFSGKLPTVILFHGLTNTRKDCPLIDETAKTLTENGFIAFRFDFYGSGESAGYLKDKTIDILEQNAEDAIKFICQNSLVDSERIGIWGRSIGGTVACLLPRDKKIKTRVIASGAVMFEKTFKPAYLKLKKKETELEKVGQKLPGTGDYKGVYLLGKQWFKSLAGIDKKIYENLKKLDTILVLGTAKDQKVSIDNACLILNTVKEPKRIWIYPADHDYAGVEKQAIEETVRWFKRYL